ncbi:MAG: iron-sulfur cluster insertion protein ErpA [Chloroflexi bacterium]|nr:iron-sulfur cluster insertion protein ErpA [Chloroflexota bacterium]
MDNVETTNGAISITEKAAEKAKALLAEKGVENGALRVFVAGGGCSGYQYGMTLANEVEEDDFVLEHGGVKVLIDPESAPLLKGAEIDYVEDVMKSGFTIFNPNAVKSCACGSSFDTADSAGAPSAHACS